MKTLVASLLFVSTFNFIYAQDSLRGKPTDTLMLETIEIVSIRADQKAPLTKSNLNSQQIKKLNLGQDLPFILNQLPSVVVNSDAGNGLGYTGIRIRGSDASRINVTLNGIPYNDPESQGTFFVDMPDIASSLNSIQVQRGVGTSSNGASAFGATINLSTNTVNKERYAELNNSYGSFNSIKNTIKLGTGLIGGHFTFDGRLSGISSDGFVDRAKSSLRSFSVSMAYLTTKSSLRFNIISGREKTYQSWYGIPESYLDTNRTYNPAGMEKPGTPYKNETDNYTQTHYQLFYNHKINDHFKFNVASFLTRGKGYYEEYRADQRFAKYGLPDYVNGTDTIVSTDLVRQLWLDNYFYGTIFSIQHDKNKTHLTLGGGVNRYDAKHYDIVKWTQYGSQEPFRYVNLPANKSDINFYGKILQTLGSGFSSFLDLQGRFVDYNLFGFKAHPDIVIKKNYSFFNPKVGVTFNRNYLQAYLSYSTGTKEPNRDDFEAGIDQLPKPEVLHDLEMGIENSDRRFSYGLTMFYMGYKNQLVNTGKINDVGAYTRTNTPESYRIGAELQGTAKLNNWMNIVANFSLTENKIKSFSEYIDDYDNGGQLINTYHNTDISFSPAKVGFAAINFIPVKSGEISWQMKYVSRQFLDNTSNIKRSIDPYLLNDLRLSYTLSKKFVKEVNFIFQVNNLLNTMYESNGYTYNYFSGGKLGVENYYFPMAGINFLGAINIKL
ncbi:MAG: TonB-dependent receptor plug domain-containing protein [Ginsengibacter sp.]